MKENTNLVTKTPEELSPVEEKELLSLIKAEASSFVPDKLCEILEACGIESGVSEEDEAFVLGLMKTNVFVPNDKEALNKATGAFAPKAGKEEQALARRMRREANAFVPDKKREIYSETGLKEHFSFARFMKKGWPFLSGAALAVAGIAIGTRVYAKDQENIKSTTSYINVAITPSTCEGPAYARDDTTSKTNNYRPSWGMTADNNNLVKQVSANNYSANLIAVKSDDLLEKSAYHAVADLINPCFEKGYLEAVDKTSPNTITIDIVSTMDNYGDVYEDHFKDALESALQKDRVYANVQFNVYHIGSLVKTDTIKMGKISKIYTTFNREIDVETIADGDENILDNLDTTINATALARLSEAGLEQLTKGLKETYLSYLGVKPITSNISEYEFNARKNDLANMAWCLRRYFGTDDYDKLSSALSRDDGAIYVSDLNVFMIDENPMLKDNYREVRNYILAKATSSKENYIRFLEDLARHAKSAQKSTGYFPDASKADPGVWSHGEGWCEDDWGPGGWAPGGWGPGDWHF